MNRTVDAFDADVLIYAATEDHPLGRRVRALFPSGGADPVGIGSVLLLAELLTKPTRDRAEDETMALGALLGRIDLRPIDRATAEIAVILGATHRLRAADALHLATAVAAGADRFITNNRRDFGREIAEIDVTYPDDLADPDDPAPPVS